MAYRELRYRGHRFDWAIYGGCYSFTWRLRLWKQRQDGALGWRSHTWSWLGWHLIYKWWPSA